MLLKSRPWRHSSSVFYTTDGDSMRVTFALILSRGMQQRTWDLVLYPDLQPLLLAKLKRARNSVRQLIQLNQCPY